MILSRSKLNLKFMRNLLIISVIFLAILSIMGNYFPYNKTLDKVIFLIVNLLVLIILFYVAKKSCNYNKRAFKGWILIALSILVTIIGNIIWMLPSSFNFESYSFIADIFYLAYYPLTIIGILYLPVNKIREFKKYQILLDTGIIIVVAALIVWTILINPILQKDLTMVVFTSLSYLLLDIFLLFTLIYLLFNWFGDVNKVSMSFLTFGALILVLSNFIFVYQLIYEGKYTSSALLDAGWLISYILTALSGISYINNRKFNSISFPQFKFIIKSNWSTYLPFLWLFFIYSLLIGIYIHPNSSDSNILIAGALIIITMVFARQIFSLKEINMSKKLLEENQEKLEKRERRLSLITDNMMDIVTMCSSSGIYQYVSPSSAKILGFTPQEMLGKNVSDFVHPHDLQLLNESFINAYKNNTPNEVEYRCQTSSGNYIWIQTVGKPLFNEKNVHQGFVCNSRNVNDRKHAEEQTKASLKENRILLKEIHHRVKNNMQIVSSLLSLQSLYIEDKNAKDVFKESQDRVKSMAMIHENLYQTSNLAKINFDDYIKKLVIGLFNSYNTKVSSIEPKLDLCKVSLDIDTAIPCGLILNELVTNSIKHAFKEVNKQKCIINVKLSQESENILEMVVNDNGNGFPKDIDFQNTTSLGLQLVNTLVNQISGSIELKNDNGTEFKIRFKSNN